ncbi:MAG: 23S rRNA (adenine(2503)-C(2))-methyltransferase RlmN [Candidatus Omnitrophota bacterium]
MDDKTDIKNFTLQELKERLIAAGDPAYRANQIFGWIYRKGVTDFEAMVNIPISLKNKINNLFCFGSIKMLQSLKSNDGTGKFLFQLADGRRIETVSIPAKDRETACLSTQVGCKYRCLICASGQNGFVRNLTVSEMISQLLFLIHTRKSPVTNVVFMGMGEPFDNYENLIKVIRIINSPEGLNIGARRLTVSTGGLIPEIKRFAELGLQVHLAVSLHASNSVLRSKLVPVSRKYPLEELIPACKEYTKKTGRKITLEYTLIQGVNDTVEDARQLAVIAGRIKAKVNIIPLNVFPGLGFRPSGEKVVSIFIHHLQEKGVKVTRRHSRGQDIAAACGQLAGRRGT